MERRTQTLNLTFLYVTVSTLKPTVGMVVTLWFNFNLYRIATRQPTGDARHNAFALRQIGGGADDPGLTGFASRIESEHEDSHLLIPEQLPWDLSIRRIVQTALNEDKR